MISHADYAGELVSLATGWLDMPFNVAMRTDCCAILFAYDAKMEMLRAVHGGGSAAEPDLPALTPDALRGMK